MSLNDIPGYVQIGRRWPLGVLVALLIGGTWFAFETRASDADIKKRLDRLEEQEKQRVQTEKEQAATAYRIGERMARLETRIDLATDLLKEIRDGLQRRPRE